MKMQKILAMAVMGILALGFSSCENGDADFPDYEGGVNVYFAHQFLDRTVVLGDAETLNTTDDNNHIIRIVSTMGGARNGKNITLKVAVDESLCDNLFFEDGVTPVKPMPTNYYTLDGNTINYNGEMLGRLKVKLEDAFFADPECVKGSYVIPVRILEQVGADSILSGKPMVDGETPSRTNLEAWSKTPQDYVLYKVKYMNPWEGFYLRRGTDKITENGQTKEETRQGASIEKDEVCQITTKSLTEALFPVSVSKVEGKNEDGSDKIVKYTCNLKLTFDNDGNVTVSSDTEGMTATGSGKFEKKAAKLAWGNKDRDLLTLNYKVDFGCGITMETSDQFVAQTRGDINGIVTFNTKYVQQ